MLIELDPVDRITADAIGPAGARVFYLQARRAAQLVTVLVEKQQVQLLAASILEILARVGKETGEGSAEESMGLEEPLLPEWRAGRLAIGYHEDRDMVLLEVEEIVPGEEEGEEAEDEGGGEAPEEAEEGVGRFGPELEIGPLVEQAEQEIAAEIEEGVEEDLEDADEPEPDAQRVRFWATREQMLSLARHGAAVCARGRPRCQLCGNPIDPEGHQCPALNGHRETTSSP